MNFSLDKRWKTNLIYVFLWVKYIALSYVHTDCKESAQMPYHLIYVDWIKLKLKENNIFAYQSASMACVCGLEATIVVRKSNELNNFKNQNWMDIFGVWMMLTQTILLTSTKQNITHAATHNQPYQSSIYIYIYIYIYVHAKKQIIKDENSKYKMK